MIIALYIAAAIIMAVGSLYFAWRNRDFRKFLAGAFFVSSGIMFYLYLADVRKIIGPTCAPPIRSNRRSRRCGLEPTPPGVTRRSPTLRP